MTSVSNWMELGNYADCSAEPEFLFLDWMMLLHTYVTSPSHIGRLFGRLAGTFKSSNYWVQVALSTPGPWKAITSCFKVGKMGLSIFLGGVPPTVAAAPRQESPPPMVGWKLSSTSKVCSPSAPFRLLAHCPHSFKPGFPLWMTWSLLLHFLRSKR